MSTRPIPTKEVRSLFDTYRYHPFRNDTIYDEKLGCYPGRTRYDEVMEQIKVDEEKRRIRLKMKDIDTAPSSSNQSAPTPMNVDVQSPEPYDLPEDFDMNIIYSNEEINHLIESRVGYFRVGPYIVNNPIGSM
jgi:hypothetical protein